LENQKVINKKIKTQLRKKSTDSSKNKKMAKARNKLGGGSARGKSRKQK
jgi:hypothetical protein